jgi:hypothetical protein
LLVIKDWGTKRTWSHSMIDPSSVNFIDFFFLWLNSP